MQNAKKEVWDYPKYVLYRQQKEERKKNDR